MITDFIFLIQMHNKVDDFEYNNIFYKIKDNKLIASKMKLPFRAPNALLFKKVDMWNLQLKNKFITWNNDSMISSDSIYRLVSTIKYDYIIKSMIYLLLVIDKDESLNTLRTIRELGYTQLADILKGGIVEVSKLM